MLLCLQCEKADKTLYAVSKPSTKTTKKGRAILGKVNDDNLDIFEKDITQGTIYGLGAWAQVARHLMETAQKTDKSGTVDELVVHYWENSDNDGIVATIFLHCFKTAVHVAQRTKWYFIEEQDKISMMYESLWLALWAYEPTKDNLFVTFWMRCFENKMKNMLKANSYDKRCVMNVTDSYDNTLGNGEDMVTYIDAISYSRQGLPDEFNECEIMQTVAANTVGKHIKRFAKTGNKFSQTEKTICEIIITERAVTDSEIARVMGITSSAVKQARDSIKKKMVLLYPEYA